ncbi:MAG TPA: hypothetical protein VHY20_05660, partial [Pirellulales bacterium]|nr:hypothetical protein [Pirellulales bacterium]
QRLDFHHLETRGSQELDRVLSLLHAGQRELQANQVCLPDPVVFRFSDRSRLARSEVLLNLFDYSGEVFRMLDLERPLRRRMMQADGILLFLDPLRAAESQLHEMKRFLDDADRNWLRMPGAVCISKIDMLQASDAAPEIGEFQQRLREIDGSGLAAIDARSRITEPLVRSLWSDVDMDRIVRKTFRGHFRYFPVTSVGFAEPAAIAQPQFVLEPLLWLLEQNGFDVFDRGKPIREVRP